MISPARTCFRSPRPRRRTSDEHRSSRHGRVVLQEGTMIERLKLMTSIGAVAGIAMGLSPASAKECYAPDARAQERAFSRAVTTEGGKIVWLGGQTGSPDQNFDGQVRQIFS